MNQSDKARQFHALHVKGAPLVLYNIWDAGSAKALAEAGAPALATGSWSVAAAHGLGDGQALPLEMALQTAGEIVAATDLPVSIDFEGAYGEAPEAVARNVGALIEKGAIGLNFEDQIIGQDGLFSAEAQAARIAAARSASDVPFFLNARTDVFLKYPSGVDHPGQLDEAIARAEAYAEAGADGFFVPGLCDLGLIADLCSAVRLPVNIMAMGDKTPSIPELSGAGVARVSFGPAPYRLAMQDLVARFAAV